MIEPLKITWCDNPDESAALAEFFAANVTSAYISHSELQGPRALSPGQWSGDIAAVLEQDFKSRCGVDHGLPSPGQLTKHAIAATQAGKLVAVAMLTFSREAAISFGIVEDIVVCASARGQGVGTLMVDWILDIFQKTGLERAFLESGKNNDAAHRFFQQRGFRQVSMVMMAELGKLSELGETA